MPKKMWNYTTLRKNIGFAEKILDDSPASFRGFMKVLILSGMDFTNVKQLSLSKTVPNFRDGS